MKNFYEKLKMFLREVHEWHLKIALTPFQYELYCCRRFGHQLQRRRDASWCSRCGKIFYGANGGEKCLGK